MPTIVGIKFPKNRKVYYFSPKDYTFQVGDHAIVESARGLEYAEVAIANREVEDREIKGELKSVVRKASARDDQQAAKLQEMGRSAIRTAAQKAEARGLVLKFVDCQYTFDQKKVVLYFTADGRVDFRELVKDLAQALHARIELCQIYERDDIKMRGALGPCGRPCCCHAFLGEFEKVSIKMAKVQGLSLNPTKISGMCGKLMCCLKYESEYYNETAKIMPKVKNKVVTPDGEGVVDGLDMLRKEVNVKFVNEDNVTFKRYPLADVRKVGAPQGKPEPEEEDDESEEIPEGIDEQ